MLLIDYFYAVFVEFLIITIKKHIFGSNPELELELGLCFCAFFQLLLVTKESKFNSNKIDIKFIKKSVLLIIYLLLNRIKWNEFFSSIAINIRRLRLQKL